MTRPKDTAIGVVKSSTFRQRIRSAVLGGLGYRFICPICNGLFRRFLTFGVKPRPNAECPGCGSLERHRLLWLYLRDKTNFFIGNLKVLHIAPMLCLRERFSRLGNLNYITVDVSPSRSMLEMDITKINTPDSQFDCVICYHVLEHVQNDHKAMKELSRVLKPGGWAIIQSPMDYSREKTYEDPDMVSPEERERAFYHKSHVRIYGRDYKKRLGSAGFSVRSVNYVTGLGQDKIKRHGLMRNEIIFLCTRQEN